jgi:putative heme iron utilization protein
MAERPVAHQLPAAAHGGGGAPASGPESTTGDAGAPPPEPSHAERCRTLVASAHRGALSTLAADPEGYPYGSVASYGLDDRGNPLFFVSLMAEHTQNAIRDARASLLVAEPVPDGADPLASGRATLLGLLSAVDEVDRPGARHRYLAANPTAAYYIDFGDFAFYRLDVQAIRYVGGYGRMSWVDAAAYAAADPDPLAPLAPAIIEHMNADHAEAQVLFCRHLAGRLDTTAATMSAVDRYGFEMTAVSPARRAAVRLGFPEPCTTADEVRRAMIALVADARSRAAGARGAPHPPEAG